MAVTLVNTANVTDVGSLELNGAQTVAAGLLGAITGIFVGGFDDDGVSFFAISDNDTLVPFTSVPDAGLLELDGVLALHFIESAGGASLLFAGGAIDDGISSFVFADPLTPLNTANFGDSGAVALGGVSSFDSLAISGQTYLFAAGPNEDGVSSFAVSAVGVLTHRNTVFDGGDRNLNGAGALAAAKVGDANLLFVAGYDDDGLTVYEIEADGDIGAALDDFDDNGAANLDGVLALATAVVGGETFLFTAANVDDGLSVFRVSESGSLVNVDNVGDNATRHLDGAAGIATAEIAGVTYVFASGFLDSGVSVFAVTADGQLVNMANIVDDDDTAFFGPVGLATIERDGDTYLAVTGAGDDGLSLFRIETTGLTIKGTGGDDVINALNAPDGEFLPSELGDRIEGRGGDDAINALGGKDKVFGGSGADLLLGGKGKDVLSGGTGRDELRGGSGRDFFDFNTLAEAGKGSARDRVLDLDRGDDDRIDLRTIDAKTGVSGNQAFKFIGTDSFNDKKGELRCSGGILRGDVNGDGKADFEVKVNFSTLVGGDLLL